MTSLPTHEVTLTGCTSVPLAGYLKALAVLRLVAEQKDAGARGCWDGDVFALHSTLDEQGLLRFLLDEYVPTPIVAPWNGGSGFYPGDRRAGIDAIRSAEAPRMALYRQAILACERDVIGALRLSTKPGDCKRLVLVRCRSSLPETALDWLDAAFVLTTDAVRFPPLLGTGGNDGRLDFSNNFMQRLCDLVDLASPHGEPTPRSEGWLRSSLHADTSRGLLADKAIGQFLPGSAGGANATTGYDAESLVNPWDFVLMIEGALLFAASTSRRLGGTIGGQLAFPFTVRSAGAGHGSLAHADAESSRNETWLPLWTRPAGLPELKSLLSEGRAQVSRRVAVDGVDFARAVARLGVDRGLTSFERVGYLQRNGLSYLAIPLGRWEVTLRPETERLDEVDRWLASFARAAEADRAPTSFVRALSAIQKAILSVCREGTHARWQQLIVALGAGERAMVASPKTMWDDKTRRAKVPPLPRLDLRWLPEADDGSVEFRLARALASVQGPAGIGPLRANMAPLAIGDRGRVRGFAERLESNDVVWGRRDLAGNLIAVLRRRCLEARRRSLDNLPLDGSYPARLRDVVAFLAGEIDERKVEDLLWGLNAIGWPEPKGDTPLPISLRPIPEPVPAAYALLKLAHLPWAMPLPWSAAPVNVRHDPETLALACAGRGEEAMAVASRRMRSSGLGPLVRAARVPESLARRIAAALMFPLSRTDAARLAELVIAPPREG